jgi:hypothetical protein
MLTDAPKSTCHPTRNMHRDGLCRYCWTPRGSSDDDWPARVANTVQQAGTRIPPACPKCGGAWRGHDGYLGCVNCGGSWHLTSGQVIAQPRSTLTQTRAARALRGTRRRWQGVSFD